MPHGEGGRTPVASEAAVQLEAAFTERFMEPGHELAAEQPAQHADGQEEAGPAGPPRASVLAQSTGRHHTVYVRMVDERLAPGMEDGEAPEPGAELPRVRGDPLKRTGGAAGREMGHSSLTSGGADSARGGTRRR